MNLRTITRATSLALLLATAPALHAKDSGDCDVPIDLGKKPEMSDHSQLNAFIAAALEYKAQQKKQDQHRKSCPELYLRPPTVWIDDPTVTQGPETLESAVERSESFPSLDYSSTSEWYGRSTSESFSLADASSDQLADSLIRTSLDLGNDAAGTLGGAQDNADNALTDAERRAILLLSVNGVATENGSLGQGLSLDQLTQTLFLTERDVSSILASEIGDLVTLAVSPGNIGVYSGADGQNILVDSQYEIETCLASCGEFQITIGWR